MIYIRRYGPKITGKFMGESHLHRDIISSRLVNAIQYCSKPAKGFLIDSPYLVSLIESKKSRPMNPETQYDITNDIIVNRNRVSKYVIKMAELYYSEIPKDRLCKSAI